MKKYLILLLGAVVVISTIFFKNSIYNAVIASIFFYVYPFLVGSSLNKIISKKLKTNSRWYIDYLVYWICGAILIYIISLAISLVKFSLLILIMASLIPAVIGFYNLEIPKISNTRLLFYISIIVVSIFFVIFYYHLSPYPYYLSWDQTVYGFESNAVINSNFHAFTSQISETMHKLKYRPTIFPLILGISSWLCNVNPFLSQWALPFLTTSLFGIFCFELYIFLTKRKVVSVIAAIISIGLFESTNLNGIRSISPATLVLLFLPIITLATINLLKNRNKEGYISLFIPLLGLLLIQPYEGMVLVFITIAIILSSKYEKLLRILGILLSVYLIITILILILQYNHFNINLGFLSYLSVNWDLNFKLLLLDRWFTSAIIFLSLIGASLSIFTKDKIVLILSVYYLGLLSIYTLGISAIFRIIIFMHCLIIFFCFYPFYNKNNKKIISLITTIAVISVLFTNLAYFNYYYPLLSEKNLVSSYSPSELLAGEFIERNISKNALLVGEPEQISIFSGISGIESFGGRSINAIEQRDIIDLSNGKINNFQEKCAAGLYFVDSFRFDKWLSINKTEGIYFPQNINSTTIYKSVYSTPIYSGDEGIKIYKINCD